MAAIAHGKKTQLTAATTQSASFVDVFEEPSTSFVGSATYLLVVTTGAGMNHANTRIGVRLSHGTTPTEILGSRANIEHSGNIQGNYSYATVFEQPATPDAIQVQFKTGNAARIAKIDNCILSWIRLDADLTENTDWFFVEQDDEASPVELPLSFGTEFAGLTFTPGNNNDEWLVMSTARISIGSTSESYDIRLNREGTDLTPEYRQEGEQTDEFRVDTLSRVYQLADSSQTFDLQAQEDSAGADHAHAYSNIIALRLDAFEEHHFTYTEGAVSATNAWSEIIGIAPFTPATAGDFFIYGSCTHDPGVIRACHIRAQIGGTTVPTGYVEATNHSTPQDPTDQNPLITHAIENLAASSQDIDFDGNQNAADTGDWRHRLAVAFSMELAAGAPAAAPVLRRRQRTTVRL